MEDYVYSPLQRDEIRVLELKSAKGNGDTIEGHVKIVKLP